MNREELSKSMKTQLNRRMVANYYGFWANKGVGAYGMWRVLQKYLFREQREIVFWAKSFGVLGVGVIGMSLVDWALREQLFSFVERLRKEHGSQLDLLRKDYLANKLELDLNKQEKLEELRRMGKNIKIK